MFAAVVVAVASVLAAPGICVEACAGTSKKSASETKSGTSKKSSSGTSAKSAKSEASAKSEKSAEADNSEDELYDGREELPGENFDAEWPDVTRIADMLPARTVQEGPEKWIYETQHFRFVADAPIALSSIKEIARIFEGTYTANLALPISSPCNFWQVCERGRYEANLYKNYDDYLRNGGHEGTAGICWHKVWWRGGKIIGYSVRLLVPFSSLCLERQGNRYIRTGTHVRVKTLAHEITHAMASPGANLPKWLSEGLAEYVSLSYDGNGRFRFLGNKNAISKFVSDYGEKHDGGRAIGKKPYVDATLRQFLCDGGFPGTQSSQVNYGVSALLVYYFFHLDGKRDAARIKKYIAAIHRGVSKEEAAAFLLDGRDWAQLENDICRRLKSVMKVEPQFKPEEKKK